MNECFYWHVTGQDLYSFDCREKAMIAFSTGAFWSSLLFELCRVILNQLFSLRNLPVMRHSCPFKSHIA